MPKTLVVVDDTQGIPELDAKVVDFNHYLSDFPKLGEPKLRIINLCNTRKYLSQGYYCSLLAEARKHRVLPSVSTINDLDQDAPDDQAEGLEITLPQSLLSKLDELQTLLIYFGVCEPVKYRKVARHLFQRYPAPILQVSLSSRDNRVVARVNTQGLASLDGQQREVFFEQLDTFTRTVWRSHGVKRKFRWDMAILHNPEEATPPSDSKALKRFVKAASKVGINAELVTASQIGLLNRFDALFIRETTSIKHHTYALARKAEQDGLIVMDDSQSILRCCNKVFLHDAFTYNHIPAPRTVFVSDSRAETLDRLDADFGYPMVLKLPESSFSLGVFKVKSRDELADSLNKLLANSALVLVQEYLYTEFDWRIGVLNGRPLYACKYFMARDHWQIYNHGESRAESGDFETMATFEVPRQVLDAAIRACKFIGNSLYGVDLKQSGDKVYVIEVNDNPSLEHQVEDKYLGNELYMQVMQEFADRLEQRGR